MQLCRLWNFTFPLRRPRPALELCGGGLMTTESLLCVTGGCGWGVTPLVTGKVFEDESKKGFLVERTPESFPSIMVVVLPWDILPPSGHCPLLRARIIFLLVNPFICWLRCSEFPFEGPLIIVWLVPPAVPFRWPLERNTWGLSGDLERGSSLKGSLSGVGK